jgi:hypothetical protein
MEADEGRAMEDAIRKSGRRKLGANESVECKSGAAPTPSFIVIGAILLSFIPSFIYLSREQTCQLSQQP